MFFFSSLSLFTLLAISAKNSSSSINSSDITSEQIDVLTMWRETVQPEGSDVRSGQTKHGNSAMNNSVFNVIELGTFKGNTGGEKASVPAFFPSK